MSEINQQKLFDEIEQVLATRDQPGKQTTTIAILDLFAGAADLDTAEYRIGLSTRDVRKLLSKLKGLRISRETISRYITNLVDEGELDFIGCRSTTNIAGRKYDAPTYSRVR